MEGLVLPPTPQWYNSNVFVCAPDGTLVYGAKDDLVVVKKDEGEPPQTWIVPNAHPKLICSVSVNKSWGNPNKYIASMSTDSLIQVWDAQERKLKFSLTTPKVEKKFQGTHMVFAGDDRIVSISEGGIILIWNFVISENRIVSNMFKKKSSVTCISSCPHASWLLAVGLSNGFIFVIDCRRNGSVLYNLRGHTTQITSLSWCPVPINIFPKHPNNTVKELKPAGDLPDQPEAAQSASVPDATDEITDRLNDLDVAERAEAEIPKEAELEEAGSVEDVHAEGTAEASISKEEKKEGKKNPWNLCGAGDAPIQDTCGEPTNDFLQDCLELKWRILKGEKPAEPRATTSAEEKSDDGEKKDLPENLHKDEDDGRREEALAGRSFPEIFDHSQDFFNNSFPQEDEIEKGDRKEANKGNDEQVSKPQVRSIITSVEEEPRPEFLLASSAKERRIYVWRGGTDGRMQTFFTLPQKTMKKSMSSRKDDGPIAISWISPTTILCSVPQGEIHSLSPLEKNQTRMFKLIHTHHINAVVFNIAAPLKCLTAANWKDEVELDFWSHDQHGIVKYAKSKQACVNWHTISGITCISQSPLDATRLTIGSRDGSIKTWDVGTTTVDKVVMTRGPKRMKIKISSTAWHPTQEFHLGFGTGDGTVGYIDTNKGKTYDLVPYFQSEVFKVEWGPINGDKGKMGLYAVAEGQLIVYDLDRPHGSYSLYDTHPRPVRKFAWKPDYSLLLVTLLDGTMLFLNPELETLNSVTLSDKGFNLIYWHPDAGDSDPAAFKYCNWFAGSTDKSLLLYDCELATRDEVTPKALLEKRIVLPNVHSRSVTAMAWSPFNENYLVTTASDGLIHVWDVSTVTVISTYIVEHFPYIQVILWNPVDPDLIMFCSRTITVYNMKKYPAITNPEFYDQHKLRVNARFPPDSKDSSTSTTVVLDKDNNVVKKIATKTFKKPKSKSCIVPTIYASNDEQTQQQISNMEKLLEGGSFDETDPLNLFGTPEELKAMMTKHRESQIKQLKYEYADMISLWTGDISGCVKDAIAENRVTPRIISMAPMVSHKVWQDACESYAKKLSEESPADMLLAAGYYLTCHKILEAINCLCLGSMFREALTLAKCRMPENSPIIVEVTDKWAEQCLVNGNFELAAQCYISIGQIEKAAKVLSKRSSEELLNFAHRLATKVDSADLLAVITSKLEDLTEDAPKAEAIINQSAMKVAEDTEDEKDVCELAADVEVITISSTEEEEDEGDCVIVEERLTVQVSIEEKGAADHKESLISDEKIDCRSD